MNVNEVIANVAHINNNGNIDDLEKLIHPNDDVNKSQSLITHFPLQAGSCSKKLKESLLPAVENLKEFEINQKNLMTL